MEVEGNSSKYNNYIHFVSSVVYFHLPTLLTRVKSYCYLLLAELGGKNGFEKYAHLSFMYTAQRSKRYLVYNNILAILQHFLKF